VRYFAVNGLYLILISNYNSGRRKKEWIKLIALTILLIFSQLSDVCTNFAYERLSLLFVLNFTFDT
jgi:hypothetical protein